MNIEAILSEAKNHGIEAMTRISSPDGIHQIIDLQFDPEVTEKESGKPSLKVFTSNTQYVRLYPRDYTTRNIIGLLQDGAKEIHIGYFHKKEGDYNNLHSRVSTDVNELAEFMKTKDSVPSSGSGAKKALQNQEAPKAPAVVGADQTDDDMPF